MTGFKSSIHCPRASHTSKCNPSLEAPCLLNQPPSPLLHTALEAAQGSSGQIGQQQSLLKSSCFLLLRFLPSPEALPSKESGGDKAWLSPSDSLHPINPVCQVQKEGNPLVSPPSSHPPVCSSAPPAHVDPLPCYPGRNPPQTHPCGSSLGKTQAFPLLRRHHPSVHTTRQRSSPFPSPSWLLLLDQGAFPLPQPSPPTLPEQHKQEGEAEELLPLHPSGGVPCWVWCYPQLLLVSSAGEGGRDEGREGRRGEGGLAGPS